MKKLILILAVLFTTLSGFAQKAPLIPIHVTGPTSNRVNIVFLGDAYLHTKYDSLKFLSDVSTEYNYLITVSPFSNYQAYINWYAIYTPSVDSSINHPHTAADCPPVTTQPTVTGKNTFYASTFDAYGIHRAVLANQATINNVLVANAPFFDLSAILVNTPYYGGLDMGSNALMTMDGSSTSKDGMAHELIGHAYAGVGDEYDYGGCGGIEQWNATQDTNTVNGTLIRWNKLFKANGRPYTDNNNVHAGIYQGANYCPTGWYRGDYMDKMNVLGNPFGSVCAERIVLAPSYYVNTIDAFTPTATSINLSSGISQTFSITTVNPVPNSLQVIWTLDGSPAGSGANNITLNNTLKGGTHSLSVSVLDTTHYNKDYALKTYSQAWTVTTTGTTPPPPPPAAPTGLATANGVNVPLSCNAITGATLYTFKLNTGQIATSLTPGVVFAGLPSKTSFTATVTVTTASGTSTPSAPLTFITP